MKEAKINAKGKTPRKLTANSRKWQKSMIR